MAMASVRSGLLRTALRGGSRPPAPPKRGFSSSPNHDDAYETAKWEKITYLGILTCTGLAFYNLSKGHPHYEEPPDVFCCVKFCSHTPICTFATRSSHGVRMVCLK
ncbi:cytochrome c oxidase subunit 6a, mitochondrial-like isoform X1 [Gossypium arboreum]|uniref:cytochrome c oxidase subunit 6a, mitochondrial-like isoform X1 n=1 Tax=Gossypium arboreum TaxID=29729 RepID=UPI0022F1C31C|nr:cytochrome c oxidase subunit 6a, mitochondrial-like isoform X1 [Gossypium arboreum]